MLAHGGLIGASGVSGGSEFQNSSDIGQVGVAGSFSFSSGTYTVNAAGRDIWSTDDELHFVYKSLSGNGTIVARVASLSATQAWAKAGVMIREALSASARDAMALVSYSSGSLFLWRTTVAGTATSSAGTSVSAPYWVKLTRSGSSFTAYQSADGSTWSQIGTAVTISMVTDVYVGLALTSRIDTSLATATFDNVSIQ